ncbi:MAG TPA: protein kinase [Vicinamibacterales bacterium]|nr:protein kinase [Vicinamibacterales bacterium]
MTIAIGERLGPYQVGGSLGSGGMGEVYRARDTKLNRDVALKVLPDAFTADPDRLARFKREAQVLALLNHPNIAAIYGLQDTAEPHALVMELVEGPTLADRIAQGPIPLDEALAIARQIAEALAAAHDRGVIHRDLKPANIKVRADGTVKVLDFGLAKALEAGPAGRASDAFLSVSPTLASPAMTGIGLILGTAAYMSPEQARGKPADRRSDVWSFGCVLYEMLTGRQVFDPGETVSDAVAAILTREPEWSALPSHTPDRVRLLLRRCLQKDPHKRLRDIGDAGLEIDESVTETTSTATPRALREPPRSIWRQAVATILVAFAASALVGAAVWRLKPAPTPAVTRFALTLPAGQRYTTTNRQIVAMSPDGSLLAYVANNALHVKSMAELEARTIHAISGGIANPTFSPDSRAIAFWSLSDRTIRRVAVTGGAPVAVTSTVDFVFFGMSWDVSGILWGEGAHGIMRITPEGGTPEKLASVKEGELAHGPQILPGGRALLFTLGNGSATDRWDKAQIVVQSLTSGKRKTIIQGGSDARYLASGHLVYAISGTLFAAPFDVNRLEISGSPTPVLEGVRRSLGGVTGSAQFSVSDTGSLLYVPGPSTMSAANDLGAIDRTGSVQRLKFPPASYEHPRVSPDGKRIAFGTDDGKEAIVWVYDLDGATAMRRLTFGGRNRFPIWSADGTHVAFQSDRDGDLAIFWQPADGAGGAERLTRPDAGTTHVPECWSPKGDALAYDVNAGGGVSLWTSSPVEKKARRVDGVQSVALTNAVFSPDGKWLAWTTSDVGGAGILVQPFPSTGARYQITSERGIYPLWSHDGRTLFFTPPGELHSVTITTQPNFVIGIPASLPRGFLVNGTGTPRTYDLLPDGRFIGVIDPAMTSQAGLESLQVLVLNWFTELKQRVPTR